jgi:hypothetical protein
MMNKPNARNSSHSSKRSGPQLVHFYFPIAVFLTGIYFQAMNNLLFGVFSLNQIALPRKELIIKQSTQLDSNSPLMHVKSLT